MQLATDIDHPQEVLAAMTRILHVDLRERFQTGTDPDGNAWTDWSETYRDYAESHSRGPVFGDRANLQLKLGMRRSILREGNWRVTEDSVFYDTSGVDPKWAWHQFGVSGAKRGKGGALPKRPIFGMGKVAEAKILAIYAQWLDGEIVAATSSTGKPFFRHAKRNRVGQFAPR